MRILAVLLSLSVQAAVDPQPLTVAADYYYTRHDYRQALELWGNIYQKDPSNVEAVLRLAELKLMFEGRSAVRTLLVDFVQRKRKRPLDSESRDRVVARLGDLQSVFLSDAGQSKYYQALPRIERKDWEGALTLLDAASEAEHGNVTVLLGKADCERELGWIDRYLETLKTANASDPFDPVIATRLAEAQLYYGAFDEVTKMFDLSSDLSSRDRTTLGVALFEKRDYDSAMKALGGLPYGKKQKFSPIVYFVMGKVNAQNAEDRQKAVRQLKFFLRLAKRVPKGWDPYRIHERTDDAREVLTELAATEISIEK